MLRKLRVAPIPCYGSEMGIEGPDHNTDVRFREEQRVRQLWIWLLTLPLSIGLIGIFVWTMVEQLGRGRPVGSQPMSDVMLVIMGPLFILLGVGLLWLTVVACLVTEVRDDGIYIRFYPFHRDFQGYLWEDIESFEARTYKPVMEYGGWGIRIIVRQTLGGACAQNSANKPA